VARLIDEMLTNRSKVTAGELQQLEEACRILDKAAAEMAKSATNRSRNTVSFNESNTMGNTDASSTGGFGDSSGIPISRVVKGQEWRMLMAYDMEVGEAKDRRLKEEKLKREADARKILDEQVAEKKRLAQLEKDQEKVYLDNLLVDLDRAQAEKDEKARLIREKNDLQNTMYAEQLQNSRDRKRVQLDEQQRKEQEQYAETLRQLDIENDRIRRKKEEEGARNQALILANEADKEYREKLRLLEIEADNKMNKEFQEKLDKEQKARDEAFAKRMEKLAKYAEQTDNGPMVRAKREEEARLEKIRERDRKAREEAAREREERDKRNRYEGRLKMQQENQKQMDEKQRRAALVKESDSRLAEKFLAEGQDAARQAREKKRLEAEARKMYGSRLLTQMEKDSAAKKEMDDMIERERRYNSKNLKNIVDDSKVYNRICGKLKLSLSEKYVICLSWYLLYTLCALLTFIIFAFLFRLKTTIQLSKSSRL
jgi:hypothetical protein